MRRQWYLVISLLLCLTVLAVACDGDAEEDVGGDDALTAEETWDEIVRAAAALDSVQLDADISADGEDHGELTIVTHEGVYRKYDGRSELDEDCDTPGAVVEPAGVCDLDRDERLWLGSETYYRDGQSGAWAVPTTEDPAYQIAEQTPGTDTELTIMNTLTVEVEAPDIPSLANPADADRVFAILPFISDGDPELELEDGVLTIHDSVDAPGDYLPSFEEFAETYEGSLDVEELRPLFEAEFANIPDRYETVATVSYDDDFRPVSVTMTVTGYKDDGTVVSEEASGYAYSRWDTAELPGPLP